MWDEAGRLTEWLGEVPIEAQLLKMAEEVGEAAEAYLGMTGLNRRKGVSHTREDLVGEVSDVIITASVAIVRLTGSPSGARAAFESHLASVVGRAEGKLVRDRIPELIRHDGLEPAISTADPAEYAARLRDKLGEEVAEFLASDDDPMELADILEVVYALAAARGTGPAELDALRAAKAASNGAFTQRLVWHGNQGDCFAAGPHWPGRRRMPHRPGKNTLREWLEGVRGGGRYRRMVPWRRRACTSMQAVTRGCTGWRISSTTRPWLTRCSAPCSPSGCRRTSTT